MTLETDGAVAPVEDTSVAATEPTAAPETPASGETEGTEPAQPAIDRPKSWSADKDTAWSQIPRDLQEVIADRENDRDLQVQRKESEAADKTRNLTVREQAAEQARQHYEAAVGQAVQSFLSDGLFADIKSSADEIRLAREDPFKYTEFLAHKEKGRALAQQAVQIQQQRAQEQQQQFQTFATEQDRIFITNNKEFADPVKATQIREKVVIPFITETLQIPKEEITTFYNNPTVRDWRAQTALYYAAKFVDAQKKALAAAPKPTPAPQKPGTPSQSGIPNLERMDMKQFSDWFDKREAAKKKR